MAGNYGLSWKQHPSSSLLKACLCLKEGKSSWHQMCPPLRGEAGMEQSLHSHRQRKCSLTEARDRFLTKKSLHFELSFSWSWEIHEVYFQTESGN